MQLPLPKHLDTDAILERIDPAKDADGLHPTNLGRLVLNVNAPITSPLPCTPRGVIELLLRNGYDLKGKDVVVVGRGVTIGRSIGLLLTRREYNATVTLTHTGTADLAQHLRQADVIVAAAGVKHIVRAEDVKPGAAVLDVGRDPREADPETGQGPRRGLRRRAPDRRRGRRVPARCHPRRRRAMTRAPIDHRVVTAPGPLAAGRPGHPLVEGSPCERGGVGTRHIPSQRRLARLNATQAVKRARNSRVRSSRGAPNTWAGVPASRMRPRRGTRPGRRRPARRPSRASPSRSSCRRRRARAPGRARRRRVRGPAPR